MKNLSTDRAIDTSMVTDTDHGQSGFKFRELSLKPWLFLFLLPQHGALPPENPMMM
jgi:hypothetical protein